MKTTEQAFDSDTVFHERETQRQIKLSEEETKRHEIAQREKSNRARSWGEAFAWVSGALVVCFIAGGIYYTIIRHNDAYANRPAVVAEGKVSCIFEPATGD